MNQKTKRPYRPPEVQTSKVPMGVHLLMCTPTRPIDCTPLNGVERCVADASQCEE